MILERRADVLELQAVHIVHDGDAVGVAHADAGDAPGPVLHGEGAVHQRAFAHIHGGQSRRHGGVSAHLHLPELAALAGDGLRAAARVHDERLFGDAVGVEPLGHAAYAVAAHLGLAAVGVEDAHPSVCAGRHRGADADDAVRADGKVAAGEVLRKGCDVLRHTAFAAVEIDIIVGTALHFGE